MNPLGHIGQVVQMTLKQGASGGAVTTLQQQLASAGYGSYLQPEGVDGKFGPHTDAAVRAFQQDAGIAVDGVVGPNTRDALARALAAQSVAATRNQTPAAAPAASSNTSTYLFVGALLLGALFIFGGSKKASFGDYRDDSGLEPDSDVDDDGDGDDYEDEPEPEVKKGADVRVLP